MDLLFPHHECEIAQSKAAMGKDSVRYWLHNNMVTINGQKMGKSLGNFITLNEFFSGNHELLDKAYTPSTIRFFMLQAHYRSTLDFSNEALQAAEKGLEKLLEGMNTLSKIQPAEKSTVSVDNFEEKCYAALNDDLNSAVLISHLFEGVKLINLIHSGNESINPEQHKMLQRVYNTFVKDILGLEPVEKSSGEGLTENLIEYVLQLRLEAKQNKDFATSDRIRDALTKLGVEIKDTKDGFEWKLS
jgi:cysteinyl-tRNA synthetase